MKMKVVLCICIVVLLSVVFVSVAQATPLPGLNIQITKWGLFQHLFGNYFNYQVEDSYRASSIWCTSLAFNSVQPGMDEGWECTDSNNKRFIIPYESITVKNLSGKTIKIVKHRIEYGHAMSYSQKVFPEKSSKLIFGEEYHAFSINFDYGYGD